MYKYIGEQLFKNLPTVGLLPKKLLSDGPLSHRRLGDFVELYGSFSVARLKQHAGEAFHCVLPRPCNVDVTIASWDNMPQYSYVGTEEYHFGLEFFKHFYGDIMGECVAQAEEVCSYIDWTKSPGWPHTHLGFRSKEELVQALSMTQFYERTQILPIYNVCGKEEFKSLADIKALKVRVFQIPPFELLYSQLKFGKRVSHRLMMKHWSFYGFNPYNGGFHRLAMRLLTKPCRGCYDVSGWDKFLSLFGDIYAVLRFMGGFSDDEMDEFDWMARHTVAFLLKLPDGRVVHKKYGNASGTGTTTRDNILAHIIIFAAGLYSAFLTKNGYAPTMQLVFEQVVALYGDDNVFSVDEEFSLIVDKNFLSQHLEKFGLKLKFFFGGVNADLSVLSFLGASFKLRDGVWYPLYDTVRLATTMLYESKKMPLSAHLSKAFTLMVMSYPSDEYAFFREAYKNLVMSRIVQNEMDDPVVKSLAFVGLPPHHLVESFFTGAEACSEEMQLVFLAAISDPDLSLIHKYDGTAKQPNDALMDVFVAILLFIWLYFDPPYKYDGKFKQPNDMNFIWKEDGFKISMSNDQSQRSASRARSMLNQLVESRRLTPEGLAWLIASVDPWHDTTISGVAGIPDQGTGKSVVFQVVSEYDISKPASLPTGPWGCRVGNFPILSTHRVTDGGYYGDTVTQIRTGGPVVGDRAIMPVQINFAAAGLDFDDTVNFIVGPLSGCDVPVKFTTGIVKVCGMGIEVINTTAQLYKQGLMTCARMVQPDVETFSTYVVMPYIGSAETTVKTVNCFRTLPKNLGEMALYPGFAQMEAKDGYYAPVTLKLGRNLSYPTPVGVLLLDQDPRGGTVNLTQPIDCYSSTMILFTPLTVPPTTASVYVSQECPIFASVDSNVVMFTGLSDQTTLTLRVRWILERFPSDSEAEILVMATPTAPYDPVALEIYSKMLALLPAGVSFTENPGGEWWTKALSKLAEIVGPMVAMIPHPYAKAAGTALTLGGAALNSYANNKQSNRKAKNAAGKYGAGKKKNKAGQVVVRRPKGGGQKLLGNPGPKKL